MNPTDPAFPARVELNPDWIAEGTDLKVYTAPGMDLRTYMATAFLQGILAYEGGSAESSFIEKDVNYAVKYADALIERLNAK